MAELILDAQERRLLAEKFILSICRNGTPDFDNVEFCADDFIGLIRNSYSVHQLDGANWKPESVAHLKLSNEFISACVAGWQSYAKILKEKIGINPDKTRKSPTSDRTDINIYSISNRFKPVINPFTGDIYRCTSSMGREWYCLEDSHGICFMSEFSQPMTYMGLEGLWVFPATRTLLWINNGYSEDDIISHVGEFYFSLSKFGREIRIYLNISEQRTVGINDFHCPHICHNFWNVMSGWSNVLENAGPIGNVECAIQYTNQNFYGLIEEIFFEYFPQNAVFSANEPNEFLDIILSKNLFVVTVKDEFITNTLKRAVLKHAYDSVSQEFLTEVENFRSRLKLLVIVTIRLDNRAWIDQIKGLSSTMQALAADFPGIGFLMDGLSRDSIKGWTTGWMSLEQELAVVAEITETVGGDVPLISGVGRSFFESIVLCDHADAFIAPIGSGMTIYKWITNAPGVAFSNRTALDNENIWHPLRVWDYYCEDVIPAIYVDRDKVVDVEDVRDTISRANFSMDWRDLYSTAKDLLADLY